MALFRVTFAVELLVEAKDEAAAIFEGRCALRDAETERRLAYPTVERITSAGQLSETEGRAFPWGGCSARVCREIAADEDIEARRPPPAPAPEQIALFADGRA